MKLNRKFLQPTYLALCTLLCYGIIGCAQSPSEVVREWEDKGWKIEKVHGEQGPIERHGKLKSDQAKAVEASWVVNGVRKTKLYSQANRKILVLRFFKKDGDQFAVVLQKKT